MPDTVMDKDFRMSVNKAKCSWWRGGYLCEQDPWEVHPCLEALEDSLMQGITAYCDITYYPPKNVKLTDTEYGLLYAPRSGETQILKWERKSGTVEIKEKGPFILTCLLYTSPSPRDKRQSRMPSSA